MSYPAAPWNLQGHALQTLHLVDLASGARELELVVQAPEGLGNQAQKRSD